MPLPNGDSIFDLLNNVYETVEPLNVYQVSECGPHLDISPWYIIPAEHQFIVSGYGSGDDGLAVKISFSIDGKDADGYIRFCDLEQTSIALIFSSASLSEVRIHD